MLWMWMWSAATNRVGFVVGALRGKSDFLGGGLGGRVPKRHPPPPFQEVFPTTFGENFRRYSRAVSRGDCHDTRRT